MPYGYCALIPETVFSCTLNFQAFEFISTDNNSPFGKLLCILDDAIFLYFIFNGLKNYLAFIYTRLCPDSCITAQGNSFTRGNFFSTQKQTNLQ